MRRGLLALLVLLGSSPVAFAQFHVVTTPGTTRVTPRVGPDEVVARIMTFDQNSDGRVAIGELSERRTRLHPSATFSPNDCMIDASSWSFEPIKR